MKDLKVLKDSLNYKEMISELLSGNYKQITKIGEKKIKINKDITYTEDILEENNISIKSLVELKDFIGNDFDCELIEE